MTLTEAWKDSLQLLKLQGLKELAVSTWHTIKEVFRILYARWFMILVSIFCVVGIITEQFYGTVELFGGLFIPLVFLAALPVSQVKDFKYFVKYLGKYSWGLFKLMMLVFMLGALILLGLIATGLFERNPVFISVFSYFFHIIVAIFAGMFDFLIIISGLTTFVMLFYLSNLTTCCHNGSIRSALKKSLIFIVYNVPLIIIYGLVQLSVEGLIGITFGKMSIVHVAIALCMICLSMTLYTKRINAQPFLYQ